MNYKEQYYQQMDAISRLSYSDPFGQKIRERNAMVTRLVDGAFLPFVQDVRRELLMRGLVVDVVVEEYPINVYLPAPVVRFFANGKEHFLTLGVLRAWGDDVPGYAGQVQARLGARSVNGKNGQ